MSFLITFYITCCRVLGFGMNDRGLVSDKGKEFAVYPHANDGFRAIKLLCEGYKIIFRRRINQPGCDAMCGQNACYIRTLQVYT